MTRSRHARSEVGGLIQPLLTAPDGSWFSWQYELFDHKTVKPSGRAGPDVPIVMEDIFQRN